MRISVSDPRARDHRVTDTTFCYKERVQPVRPAPEPSYPIGSVDSALRLLLLIRDRQEIRIAEASTELGVARSTAHRLMQMLHYHGFVRRNEDTKAYSPGPVLFDLGLQVVRRIDLRSHARPALEALVRSHEETAQLFVLQQDGQLACIDAVESTRPVRVGGRVGSVVPAYATACGLAVLAELTPDRLAQLYPDARLRKLGGSVTSRRTLEAELARTRERGYAVQREELEREVSAVAAPIEDERGHANFAVSIAAPTARLTERDVPRLGRAAMDCARAIADALPW